jgi:hypothetical protein
MSFSHTNTGRAFCQSVDRVVEMLGDLRLLTDCCSGSSPGQVTFSTRRKNIWTELLQQIDTFIKFQFGSGAKTVNAAYIKYVTEQATRTLAEPPANRKNKIIQRAMVKLPIHVGMDFSESTVDGSDFAIARSAFFLED